jgi:hypothetical protein
VRDLFDFPNPVDEVSARLVAAGVVALGLLALVTGSPLVIALLAYGFVARVLTGPKLSPLGLLITRVARPRLDVSPRLVAGPPKRFAQGVGAVVTSSALVLTLAGHGGIAAALLVMLVTFASMEAAIGLCVGCKMFALLMRAGLVPEQICLECSDIRARIGA